MTGIFKDNPAKSRYELAVDGDLCIADYTLSGDRLAINHVEVPHSLRNRGLAAELMKFAVEDSKARGLTIVPVCSYAAAYMQQNKA